MGKFIDWLMNKKNEEDVLVTVLMAIIIGLLVFKFTNGLSSDILPYTGLGIILVFFIFSWLCEGFNYGVLGLITLLPLYGLLLFIIDVVNYWWIILIVLIVLSEVIFLIFDNKMPCKKTSMFWFTVNRKCVSYFKSFVILGLIGGSYSTIRRLFPIINWFVVVEVIKWIAIIVGTIIILLVILWSYIKLNELKYKK